MIEDRSFNTGQGFDPGKFEHESMQVTLELYRAMPGLKGEGRRPHVPEFRLEERR